MNIEAINLQTAPQFQSSKAPEQVSDARKKAVDTVQSDQPKQNQIQPEEMLKQIKSLTQDGLYSVRFEHDERSNGMVVKIVDQKSDEVIRQVPSEELLTINAALADLRGNIIDTES
jgi:flagellar protein FlaG